MQRISTTATRGRSPGKFALGLRVVSDDGSPERFRQALVRGLATVVDFWLVPFIGVPALICSLLSAKGKRLGRPVKDASAAARVAALRADGMSLRAIAAAEGLSASGVRKMLLRATPALEPVEN